MSAAHMAVRLVFAAFSGSHQDAIAKGMKYREEHKCDTLDGSVSADRSRPISVAPTMRMSSGSTASPERAASAIFWSSTIGLKLPKKMREAMGYAAKGVSDELHKELQPEEIFQIFKNTFEDITEPYKIEEVHFKQHNGIIAEVTATCGGKTSVIVASGNGRLNAVSNAMKKHFRLEYDLVTYEEHALEQSSSSRAIAYVGIRDKQGNLHWGAGLDVDIIRASIDALLTAINHLAVHNK